jgi:phosphatidate cytidylyltransferase
VSKLAARVLTGASLAVLAGGLLWLAARFRGGWVALAVVTALALLACWELDRMGALRGRRLRSGLYRAALVLALAVAADLAAPFHVPGILALLLLYALALVASWPLMPRAMTPRVPGGNERLPRAREVVPLALWSLPPLFAVVLVERDFGVGGLALLIVLAKVGDNAGYFVGRKLGRRHPFPGISPGKTVAGCVASLVAGVVAGACLLPWAFASWTAGQVALGALLGGLINLAAQAGDLSESWVKRRAGVKDSSGLVGPSGGVLEVVDSLLLAAPVAQLAWSWVYAVPGS